VVHEMNRIIDGETGQCSPNQDVIAPVQAGGE